MMIHPQGLTLSLSALISEHFFFFFNFFGVISFNLATVMFILGWYFLSLCPPSEPSTRLHTCLLIGHFYLNILMVLKYVQRQWTHDLEFLCTFLPRMMFLLLSFLFHSMTFTIAHSRKCISKLLSSCEQHIEFWWSLDFIQVFPSFLLSVTSYYTVSWVFLISWF